ncbi:Triple Functional Domain Protein [Manis pentadactyla]|nr:Triple Functional Domain Protein [Manis pentadactyla]
MEARIRAGRTHPKPPWPPGGPPGTLSAAAPRALPPAPAKPASSPAGLARSLSAPARLGSEPRRHPGGCVSPCPGPPFPGGGSSSSRRCRHYHHPLPSFLSSASAARVPPSSRPSSQLPPAEPARAGCGRERSRRGGRAGARSPGVGVRSTGKDAFAAPLLLPPLPLLLLPSPSSSPLRRRRLRRRQGVCELRPGPAGGRRAGCLQAEGAVLCAFRREEQQAAATAATAAAAAAQRRRRRARRRSRCRRGRELRLCPAERGRAPPLRAGEGAAGAGSVEAALLRVTEAAEDARRGRAAGSDPRMRWTPGGAPGRSPSRGLGQGEPGHWRGRREPGEGRAGSEARAEPRPRAEEPALLRAARRSSRRPPEGASGPVSAAPPPPGRRPPALSLARLPGGRGGGAGGAGPQARGRRRRLPPWSRLCAGILRARRGGWTVAAPLAGVEVALTPGCPASKRRWLDG